MRLIAEYSNAAPEKQKMSRAQLIDLIASDAKFIDEREDIELYINSLKLGEGLSEASIRAGFEQFKAEKFGRELDDIALKYGLDVMALTAFFEETLARMILDSDRLSDLMQPLDLGWKARSKQEQALIKDLTEPMHRRANGREISGWSAYV
jgi:type I restriction enzyme R subunit